MDQPICGTKITGQSIRECLKSHFGPTAILESFEADKIASQGMVSDMLRLQLKWTVENDRLPKSVIVKAPTLGRWDELPKKDDKPPVEGEVDFADVASKWLPAAHNVECRVYEMFGENPPIKVPQFYGAVQIQDGKPGMIIMEDLSRTAGNAPSFIDGMTFAQVAAVVDEIARLQAWCLTTDIDWRSQVASVEDFAKLQYSYVSTAPRAAADIKKQYQQFESIDLEKIKEITHKENLDEIWREHRAVMDDVFAHGDYHKNNILFEKREDGTIGDRLMAIVDFQTAMSGSPTADLARLLAFSVPQAFRDKHELGLLRRYYDLTKSLAGERFKPTFEQIRRWYHRSYVIQAILWLVWTPVLLSVAIQSDGEQRKKDEVIFLKNSRDCFEHGVKNYDDTV